MEFYYYNKTPLSFQLDEYKYINLNNPGLQLLSLGREWHLQWHNILLR